ncbi:MAG: DUF4325 domain-containing protein [Thermoleophilia bacterium]
MSTTIRMAHWGPVLFGRQHGAQVRAELSAAIHGWHDVLFDFEGVENMSLSFADECFGELLHALASDPARPSIRFAHVPADMRASLLFTTRPRVAA